MSAAGQQDQVVDPVGTVNVFDPHPLNWLFITWNTMEEPIRTDHEGYITMALAESVRPEGRVITYEIVERHMETARGNIERSGLMPYVDMRLGDVTEGIPEEDLDAVVLDMATPWLVVPHAWAALAGSGVFLSFSPTIEQVMKTAEALKAHPFIEIETVELLMRNITVAPNKTRPQTVMIGHSGYLTTARKVLRLMD